MQKSPGISDFSPAETRKRMEDGIRKALSTPHKPLDKFKGKSASTGKRKPKRKPRKAAR